jgi:hypothetical protein
MDRSKQLDTAALMLSMLAEWGRVLGSDGCVPLVLIGLRPDGKYAYVAPPLDVQPLEELAGALEATLARVRERIRTG